MFYKEFDIEGIEIYKDDLSDFIKRKAYKHGFGAREFDNHIIIRFFDKDESTIDLIFEINKKIKNIKEQEEQSRKFKYKVLSGLCYITGIIFLIISFLI